MTKSFQTKFNNIVGQAQDIAGTAQAVGDLIGVPNLINGIFGNRAPTGQFSISDFAATMNAYSLLKTSLFLVRVTVPKMFGGSAGGTFILPDNNHMGSDMISFCAGASIPGISFATDDISRYGYGPMEKIPYRPLFNEVQLTFLGDGKGLIHKYFMDWMNGMMNFKMDKGFAGVNPTTGLPPYEANYKSEYVAEVQLAVYNETQDKVIEINMLNAFPMRIDEVVLNWGDTDNLMRFNVQFAYSDYYSNATPPSMVSELSGLTFLQALQKGVSITQVISTLRKPKSIGDVVNVINNANIIKNGI